MRTRQQRAADKLAEVEEMIRRIEGGYMPPNCYEERTDLLGALRDNAIWFRAIADEGAK